MSTSPSPDFTHLLAMSDELGTFEHAELTEPRRGHGYCTDDVARVLLVTSREPDPTPAVRDLAERSLRFLAQAQAVDGRYRNRRDERGRWHGRPSVDDCWGRSIWALGSASARLGRESSRQVATAQFERAVTQRSPFLRSTAFAALGAAELLLGQPDHWSARHLLRDVASGFDADSSGTAAWPWPEPRLTYANAVVPDAMIATGVTLGRRDLVDRGLALLAWLVDAETFDGHLSVVPVGGAAPGDRRGAFDQQPIEVAALADACARATTVDDAQRWSDGVAAAVDWFGGVNDGGHVMRDVETGGGFDGLQVDGPNRNEGAESTLALLSTLQHGRRLVATAA